MVLAIGTQFVHMVSGSLQNPAVKDIGAGINSLPDTNVGIKFYHMATKLIPDVITIASIESMQACLLLALYVLPVDTQGLAYTYLGLSLKMAVQNGMHRKYNGEGFNKETVEIRIGFGGLHIP